MLLGAILLAACTFRLGDRLQHRRALVLLQVRQPRCLVDVAGFYTEPRDLIAAQVADVIGADLGRGIDEAGINSKPHEIAPQEPVARVGAGAGHAFQGSDRVNTELGIASDLADGTARKGDDASGGAARTGGDQSCPVLCFRLHDVAASIVGRCGMTASIRHGAADADGHAVLAQQQAHLRSRFEHAAGRVEEERKVTTRQGRQEVAKALWSIGIEPTFGGDPFAATRAAGIGRPLGYEEDQRRPAQPCVDLGIWRRARVARSMDQPEREQGGEREQQSKYEGAHSALVKIRSGGY